MADFYALISRLVGIYGAAQKRLPGADGRALPPLFLVLELTYRCNLRCGFCYLRPRDGQTPDDGADELSSDEILSIVDQTPPWTLVLLSGGEIFVRDDVFDVLRRLARKRRCHLFTNGTRITAEVARTLIELGVSSIGVSVDGPEAVHDRLRGPGTFAAATAAIRHLAAARAERNRRRPLLNLKTTILPENAGCLAESVRLAESLGADYCTFQGVNTSARLGGLRLQESFDAGPPAAPLSGFPLPLLEGQLREVRRLAVKSTVRIRVLPDLPRGSLLDLHTGRLDLTEYDCPSPWSVMYVSPHGDVYPCLNYRIGNVREKPLRVLWNDERYRRFRRRLLDGGLFPDCEGCCDLVRRRPAKGQGSRGRRIAPA